MYYRQWRVRDIRGKLRRLVVAETSVRHECAALGKVYQVCERVLFETFRSGAIIALFRCGLQFLCCSSICICIFEIVELKIEFEHCERNIVI